jgi:hypothetical protein
MAAAAAPAECANKEFDQCGGKDWTGATCCQFGQECKADNEWYSKCERLPVCPNKEYGQCGGADWGDKDSCCVPGYKCEKESEFYSQCKPDGSGDHACADGWAQCGGKNADGNDWDGAPCCKEGFECKYESDFYSQCKPACTNAIYDQCGGKDFQGQECCPAGTECKADSEWYSKCAPIEERAPAFVLAMAAAAAPAECANKEFDQCGGKDWTGATCCQFGQECKADNEWYSKCERLPVCPNKEYGQCGGADWGDKDSCCVPGYKCEKESEFYSQCKPDGSGDHACADGWAQCGGKNADGNDWDGAPCCKEGFECKYESDFYSQCKPACTNAIYDQCGGKDFQGQECCPAGTECKADSEWYSKCAPIEERFILQV